ncbi:hypothetical protein B0F90DRAFT_406326 [Multifurca ochricompacta]|uniref:Uncharacterized protein n=1 Tax=Multifurca ochricompacta TaxID=376703 RepID=A0AAD4LVD9_9AGAM|nr:hypothetical protein B0F90DRAFT_406326 [Multifurca ochricompacta]
MGTTFLSRKKEAFTKYNKDEKKWRRKVESGSGEEELQIGLMWLTECGYGARWGPTSHRPIKKSQSRHKYYVTGNPCLFIHFFFNKLTNTNKQRSTERSGGTDQHSTALKTQHRSPTRIYTTVVLPFNSTKNIMSNHFLWLAALGVAFEGAEVLVVGSHQSGVYGGSGDLGVISAWSNTPPHW